MKGNIRFKIFANVKNINWWMSQNSIDRNDIINIETRTVSIRVWYFEIPKKTKGA